MIPLHLRISGFLSYHEPVEIDFSAFELACIAGPNGAGKSSLLDAITWALFGIARKRDDSLVNSHPDVRAAEVSFVFAYEGNIYRVQRACPRGKTNMLEFHLLQDSSVLDGNGNLKTLISNLPALLSSHHAWKPLTERSLRETQGRLETTLHMDYDTFVNASFFLQGRADQFTQQRPGDRKRILGSILGLEVWDQYRQRAAERRKAVETDIAGVEARLQDIEAELSEEQERKARLKAREEDLERLSRSRQAQEAALDTVRQIAGQLAEQGRWVEARRSQLESQAARLNEQRNRLGERQKERENFSQTLARAPQIEAAFHAWQQARADIEYWDELSRSFREAEKRRQGPLDEINAERARLAQEIQTLLQQAEQVRAAKSEIEQLQVKIDSTRQAMALAERQIEQRAALTAELQGFHERRAGASVENERLEKDMRELKARIDQLRTAEWAECPLCGQPISPEGRQKHIAELEAHGKEMGDRFRANLALLKGAEASLQSLKDQLAGLERVELAYRQHNQSLGQATSRLDTLEEQQARWKAQGEPRLAEASAALEAESFAIEARARLAEIDAGLKSIGYDAAQHDAARKAEQNGRASDGEMRSLERARAHLAPLEREIGSLQKEVEAQAAEVERLQQEFDQAAAALAAAQAQAPDLYTAERELQYLLEQENRLRMEVGMARQQVEVLGDLRARRKSLHARREELARQAGQYKQLERAFGKDGVPALLIEQALPQIEARANEILDRLSDGAMSVRFVTQASYKDKKREDLRETLDIQISDSAGTRDYEMFSGGEAFRVNFAVRLALSEVLAQRAGARLQTLVIDEGFGSQDSQGRQRLIEAINLVRPDFAKILVITHIDELKDSFPNRIEVEKTPRGSRVRVI